MTTRRSPAAEVRHSTGATEPEASPRPGAYRHIRDHSYAYAEYISAIKRVHPVVLKDLHQEVLPRFIEAIKDSGAHVPTGKHWLVFPEVEYEVLDALRPPFDDWSGRYHFHGWKDETEGGKRLVNWLESIVLSTLWEWSKGHRLEPLDWDIPNKVVVGAYLHRADPLEVALDGWQTLVETVDEFRERAQSGFERLLTEYIEQSRATSPDTHVRLHRRFVARHFDWLVQHQMKGESFAGISRELPRGLDADPRAVGQGVRVAAEALMGSDRKNWLRSPAKGGRPKGARHSG